MQRESMLTAPVAIIVAGLLVAGAILFKDSSPQSADDKERDAAIPSQLLKEGTIAEEVGLDGKTFAECLASGRMAAKVEKDYQSGIKAGVQGTPHSIVLNAKAGLTYTIGGAQPASVIRATIEAALAGDKNAAESVTVDPIRADEHLVGNPNAEVFIIEYSDLECPFCKRFHEPMREIMAEYEAGGRVAWAYRHFPLDQIHSKARKEAEATECAWEQGGNDAFWNYTNKLFEITPSNDGLNLELL